MMLTLTSKAAKSILVLGLTAVAPFVCANDSELSTSEEEASSGLAVDDKTMRLAVAGGSAAAAIAGTAYMIHKDGYTFANCLTAGAVGSGVVLAGTEYFVHGHLESALLWSTHLMLPSAVAGGITSFVDPSSTADIVLTEEEKQRLREEEEKKRKADRVALLTNVDATNPSGAVEALIAMTTAPGFVLHPEAEAALITKLTALNTKVKDLADAIPATIADLDTAKALRKSVKDDLACIKRLTYKTLGRKAPEGANVEDLCQELAEASTAVKAKQTVVHQRWAELFRAKPPVHKPTTGYKDLEGFKGLCEGILTLRKIRQHSTSIPDQEVLETTMNEFRDSIIAYVEFVVNRPPSQQDKKAVEKKLTEDAIKVLQSVEKVQMKDLDQTGAKTPAFEAQAKHLQDYLLTKAKPSARDLLKEHENVALAADYSNLEAVFDAIEKLGQAKDSTLTQSRRQALLQEVEKAIEDLNTLKKGEDKAANEANAEKINKFLQAIGKRDLPKRSTLGLTDRPEDPLVSQDSLAKLQRTSHALTKEKVTQADLEAAAESYRAIISGKNPTLGEVFKVYKEYAAISATAKLNSAMESQREYCVELIGIILANNPVVSIDRQLKRKEAYLKFLKDIPVDHVSDEYKKLLSFLNTIRTEMCKFVSKEAKDGSLGTGVLTAYNKFRGFLKDGFGDGPVDATTQSGIKAAFVELDEALKKLLPKKFVTKDEDYETFLAETYSEISVNDGEKFYPQKIFKRSIAFIQAYVNDHKDKVGKQLKDAVERVKTAAVPPAAPPTPPTEGQ